MKSCDVVSINKGIIQAIKGPIAYFGFHPSFVNEEFALDAKMFVAAIRKFKTYFKIAHDDNKIILFDEKQEVDFIKQPAEIILDFSKVPWKNIPNFDKIWNIAQKFIQPDFPGVRITSSYIEVISDKSIVRITADLKGINGIFASVKLPSNINQLGYYNNRLWFSSTPYDLIAVNSLDIMFPNTDMYFDTWPENFEVIPEILKERFVETDETIFDMKGVNFVQKEKATASIENISGIGSYDGKLFSNLVAYGDRYSFQDRFVAFEANNIKGVIARV